MDSSELTLGIHIAGGIAYAGIARCPGDMVLEDPFVSIEPSAHLAPAIALREFADRFRQELKRVRPAVVGVVRTRLYSGWKYRDAHRRFVLVGAVMMAVAEEAIEYQLVKQEGLSKAIGIPLKNFDERLAERLSGNTPTHWNNRALAFGAAVALTTEICS